MNELKQGTQIGGYTILYNLTSKAYTQTYCVADDQNNQHFMKVYDMHKIPDTLKHFTDPQELWIYQQIGAHANLLQMEKYGRERIKQYDIIYFTTPYFRGKLLSQLIDECGILSPEQAMPIALGIAQAVIDLNSHNICHLDITPQNVLLDTDDEGKVTPKLFDLEHAIEYDEQRPTRCLARRLEKINVYYSHSALLSKGEISATNDAFSIAAVIYTMLTGLKPWADCAINPTMPAVERHLKMSSWRTEHSVADLIATLRPTKKEVTQTSANLFVAMEQGLQGNITAYTLKNILLTENTELDKIAIDASRLDTRSADQLKGFAAVAGMDKLKQHLSQHVIWPLQHPAKASQYRLQLPNGILLYGAPGCGKTYFATKLAEEMRWKVKYITSASIGSTYQHETQSNIKQMFDVAAASGHCVLCIDEIDGILSCRGTESTERGRNDEVNEFLAHFNECHKRGILVIGTTNRKDIIDPAALRAGRFDIQIEIPAPDDELRQRLFEMYLRNRPLAEDIDIPALVAKTKRYSCSDIPFVVNEAALAAAIADEPISQQHLINVINCHRSSLESTIRPIGFDR